MIDLWFFLLLTILCWGTAPILEKSGLRAVDPFLAVFIRSCTVFTVISFSVIVSGKIKMLAKVPLKSIFMFMASGLLAGLIGMWAYFKVLKINPSSKVVPLSAIYPLITAVLSVILLRENITLPRIIGTILIILGVSLVK
ncbi:MAG: EamA family transporter [Candidatus Omnitrophica bacterium]|nr:EamA family transporter [Candidatus Omnitrophota bacterium]